jgi:hypothetical protein
LGNGPGREMDQQITNPRILLCQTAPCHTVAKEKMLVDWITRLQTLGHPPRRGYIRELAQEILFKSSIDTAHSPIPIGDAWVQRFLYRHPELKAVQARTLEIACAKAVTQPGIVSWFDKFKSIVEQFDILSENIYNMDETGFSIGAIKSAYVVVNKEIQSRSIIHPGRQEWVTVIECISTNGNALPPFFILKGKSVAPAWIPKSILDQEWRMAASSTGWTNNGLGFTWLKEVFEPATREKAAGQRRLLICDGHESHISSKFISFAMDHEIELILLVPHSSHITQPLDVGVFAPLKIAVGRSLDRLLRAGVARLEKVEWVDYYMKARPEALTVKNINSAWRGSGLFPFNPFKVLRHLPDDSESAAPSTSDGPKTPSTNQFNPPSLDNLQQTPSPFHMQQFTIQLAELAIRNAINTPLRQEIPKFMRAAEKTAAENILLKKQLSETEEVLSN